jgi:hypothetical protein
MALVRWILIALMAVIAVLSVSYSFGLVSSGSASGATDVYYWPMHPQVCTPRETPSSTRSDSMSSCASVARRHSTSDTMKYHQQAVVFHGVGCCARERLRRPWNTSAVGQADALRAL